MMGSIPVSEETLLRIYRCATCRKVYSAQVGPYYCSCCVSHPPGSCCHYGEEAVSEGTLGAIQLLLAEVAKEPIVGWDFNNPEPNVTYISTSTVTDGLESSEVPG